MPEPTETENAPPPSAEASEKKPEETPVATAQPAGEEKGGLWDASPALPPDEAVEDESPPDLEHRVLCPDGACVGVIGPDGRCGVCGRRAELPAEPPAAAAGESAATSPDDAERDASPDDDLPPDFAARRLCSDGACIGVIGPDDRCKVCGKPYTGEPE